MKPHEKPYPESCNHEIFSPYIGQGVVNVHILGRGVGTLISVQHGCNGLLQVEWDSGYIGWYTPSDLALAQCYPEKRWTHL